MAEVKHIEAICSKASCKGAAFVQVVIVDDFKKQAKIDKLARLKLKKALDNEHREGKHGAH